MWYTLLLILIKTQISSELRFCAADIVLPKLYHFGYSVACGQTIPKNTYHFLSLSGWRWSPVVWEPLVCRRCKGDQEAASRWQLGPNWKGCGPQLWWWLQGQKERAGLEKEDWPGLGMGWGEKRRLASWDRGSSTPGCITWPAAQMFLHLTKRGGW